MALSGFGYAHLSATSKALREAPRVTGSAPYRGRGKGLGVGHCSYSAAPTARATLIVAGGAFGGEVLRLALAITIAVLAFGCAQEDAGPPVHTKPTARTPTLTAAVNRDRVCQDGETSA